MRYLNISHNIRVLLREGTKWEFTGILSTGDDDEKSRKWYPYIKRFILAFPTIIICLFLKQGFNKDFIGYVMAALAIFIGLFTNLIIVLYQRFALLPKEGDPLVKSNKDALNNTKIKNFIRQFTFVTGKNLLIATIVIVLISLYLLFDSLEIFNPLNFTCINSLKDFNKENLENFLKVFFVATTRITIIYLLIDFCLLLLYVLGALFAFLKGEYKQ